MSEPKRGRGAWRQPGPVRDGRLPLPGAEPGDRGGVGQLRRLPDPPGGDPAGQHRPAARRFRLGAALLLPARRRFHRRGEDRGPRLPEGRPARRRRARARPSLPGAADRGAGAARGRAGEGQPEELDRPPRRLHPGHHRPPPPLRRHPRRLPRQALPGGRPALLRDPGQDRPLAQPAAAGPRRRPPRRRRDPRPAGRVAAALHRLRAGAAAELAVSDGLFLSLDLSGPARSHRRLPGEEEQPPGRPLAIRAYRWTDYWDPVFPERGDGWCWSRRSSTCCSPPRASASRRRSPPR